VGTITPSGLHRGITTGVVTQLYTTHRDMPWIFFLTDGEEYFFQDRQMLIFQYTIYTLKTSLAMAL